MEQIKIQTKKEAEVLDITYKVEGAVRKNKWERGILFLYMPHCTASLIVNEYGSGLDGDYLELFKMLKTKKWKHDLVDGNAYAHLANTIVGTEKFFIVENGKLQLGKWQSIMLVELDGPREREVLLEFLERK